MLRFFWNTLCVHTCVVIMIKHRLPILLIILNNIKIINNILIYYSLPKAIKMLLKCLKLPYNSPSLKPVKFKKIESQKKTSFTDT